MAREFDLIVIGTGVAGSTVATRCRAGRLAGGHRGPAAVWGTCAMRGCDPKKVLIGAAQAIDWVRRMEGHGLEANGARIDWAALMWSKRTFTSPVPKARQESFAEAGIATLHGGIPLQLQDGVGGFLVTTTEQCAQRAAYLLRHPDESGKIAAAGRRVVRERFLIPRLPRDELRLIEAMGSAQ